MAAMKFTHAIVCRIPQSFRTKCDVNLDEAKKQHEIFVKLLRELGLDVIELPPDENLPESVYVEDTAIVLNGSVLITRPETGRLKELETIRSVFKKELDLPIIDIKDTEAKLDGGDVLFTGREFFIGLSDKTNEAGAKAVAAAFPEYSCIPINVEEDYRLKNLVSVAGPDLLCVAATKPAQDLLKRIERETEYNYSTLTVPEEAAANVLYVNGTLVHRSQQEIPESHGIFEEKIDYDRRPVNMSELSKLGHSLSSCCLLLRRSKHIKYL
ncbi:NG,NG-dimethylarginine dimethylaminohydrolase, putative [Pediculus humanus corporis]|uniref:NG,NG-dimethylarginine dimethylaminohydrolase, putative n=1 Tax=Pediculus humanus subsp. corporis TaxID=121224 RepID=E0VW35_PEDHC|nr:NG,NG-dimethylarginine dimethylaminohydrolase, putative [Pediculus humanus corporis]EEB17591.1 NG,NG-dimethylarginine dimethylaminohydrolase, putative [Pediculus humanus corporis]